MLNNAPFFLLFLPFSHFLCKKHKKAFMSPPCHFNSIPHQQNPVFISIGSILNIKWFVTDNKWEWQQFIWGFGNCVHKWELVCDLLSRVYFGDLVTEIHYFSLLNGILAHNSEKYAQDPNAGQNIQHPWCKCRTRAEGKRFKWWETKAISNSVLLLNLLGDKAHIQLELSRGEICVPNFKAPLWMLQIWTVFNGQLGHIC